MSSENDWEALLEAHRAGRPLFCKIGWRPVTPIPNATGPYHHFEDQDGHSYAYHEVEEAKD